MKNKKDEWKGYTLQELQMHRAINAVRLEVEKEKLAARFEGLKAGATGDVASFLLRNLGSLSKGFAISSAAITIGRKIYSIVKGR